MITNNPEHKKVTLKKLVQAGKIALTVSLAGTITTITIFIHTNIIKKHEVSFWDDNYDTYWADSNTLDMINGENTFHRDSIIEKYKKEISKKTDSEEVREVKTVYDETKSDNDIVKVSEEYKETILDSLYRNHKITKEEYDTKPDITVGYLKMLSSLKHLDDIIVQGDSDISWLNYCENLYELELSFYNEKGLAKLKQINNLNVSRLFIREYSGYNGDACLIDEEYFRFLKNCPNLSLLEIDSSFLSINSDFLQKISQERNGIHLEISGLSSSSQKIDVDKLKGYKSVTLNFSVGNGVYDIPAIFSREEFNKLLNSNLDISLYSSNSGILQGAEFFEEINKIYDQIDEIMATLNINEKMSEKEKLNNILEYVLNNLTYNEQSAQIQEEQGISDIKGLLSEDLVEESKKSYTNGFLYGVFNENGKPICGNYAALMKTLLNKAGIEAYLSGSKFHAYNIVKVDNEYYYVDATFLDQDVIDIDKMTENDNHLMPLGIPGDIYDTNIIPAGVKVPDLDIEKRVDQIITMAKKDYIVKFNNQLYNVSFTALMSLLAGLGLAISKKKIDRLEKDEMLAAMSDEDKLRYLISEYKNAKIEYEDSSPFRQAYLKLSGQANFKDMQDKIDGVRGNKK